KRLAESTGLSEEEAAAQLQADKAPSAAPVDPKVVQDQLAKLRALPEEKRTQAVKDYLATLDPQQVLGAMMTPEDAQNGLVKGPVANSLLDQQLESLKGITDPRKRLDAYEQLAKLTGRTVDDLMAAQRNKKKQEAILDAVGKTATDPALTEEERKKHLE